MLIGLEKFSESVREERLFCAILFHLLLENNANLTTFVDLINGQLPEDKRLPQFGDDASVYVEFTYLRDSWYALRHNNDGKRAVIFELFSRSPILSQLASASFPAAADCGSFNERFMGSRGARIRADIAYPGQWPVNALRDGFSDPEVFRELCRLKWAFNIKPDLVVLGAGSKPVCVEAKLESREGSYPTGNEECAIFDQLFGPGQRRVKQVELQQFMFETLIGVECQPVVVGRSPINGEDAIPFLSWKNLFASLDLGGSRPFVRRLTRENKVLPRGLVPDDDVPTDSLT
jgi:hypothetical protein